MSALINTQKKRGTNEASSICPETANELFPCRACIGENDDTANELPCAFDLFFANAAGLVGAQAHAVYILESFASVHTDKLANIAPDKRGEA